MDSSCNARVVLSRQNTDYLGERRLACPTCRRRFTFKQGLKRHIETAHRYACTRCRKSYKTERRLQIHWCKPKNVTAVKPKPFLCDSCGSSYSSLRNLQIHTRKYHSTAYHHQRSLVKRRHACDQCDRKFSSKQYLEVHVSKVHFPTDGKHVCASCGASYSFTSILKEHIEVVHLKLYACQICSKDHVNQSSLDAHLKKVHEGSHFKQF